jgi:membrane-associated phospholipid phosphatase
MIRALAVAATGVAVFAIETIVVAGNPGATGFDTSALDAADDLNSGAGVAVAKVVTAFGSLPVTAALALIAAVVLSRHRRPIEAAALVAAAIAIVITVHVAKAAVDRPRPPHPLAGATLAAFPSGHSAYSTVYVAVALLARRRLGTAAAAVAIALAIGLTRIYLRVHWASDVLAGWALGAAIFGAATVIAIVVGRFRNNDRATCTQP